MPMLGITKHHDLASPKAIHPEVRHSKVVTEKDDFFSTIIVATRWAEDDPAFPTLTSRWHQASRHRGGRSDATHQARICETGWHCGEGTERALCKYAF
jgi:hypothetical protein